MPHLRSFLLILCEESLDVTQTDPNPAPRISLIALAQHQVASIARYGCHNPRFEPIQFEPENPHIVVDAGRKFLHAKNWGDTSKHGCLLHLSSSHVRVLR